MAGPTSAIAFPSKVLKSVARLISASVKNVLLDLWRLISMSARVARDLVVWYWKSFGTAYVKLSSDEDALSDSSEDPTSSRWVLNTRGRRNRYNEGKSWKVYERGKPLALVANQRKASAVRASMISFIETVCTGMARSGKSLPISCEHDVG